MKAKQKIRRLERQIDMITTDVNYAGGVQYWIRKHSDLLCQNIKLLNFRKNMIAKSELRRTIRLLSELSDDGMSVTFKRRVKTEIKRLRSL